MQGFVKILTRDQVISDMPKSGKTPRKTERNQSILLRVQQGETVADIAKEYGISEQRVHQILRS
jgi:Mor family transcriptional regulator